MKEILDKIAELAKSNHGEALRQIDTLAGKHPNEARIWATRAYINGRERHQEETIEDWTKAIKLVEEPHYVYMRGIELFQLGRYNEAISDFTRVIELCDFYKSDYYREPAYFFRADAYVRLKEFEKARSDCAHVTDDMRTWTDKLRTKADIIAECA